MSFIIPRESAVCPICNTIIKTRYSRGGYDDRKFCSCCGFPLKMNYNSAEKVKLCFRCDTINPTNANYCRCCGKDIRLDGEMCGLEHDHKWIDLGLSVLWSTENVGFLSYSAWMNRYWGGKPSISPNGASSYFQWMDDYGRTRKDLNSYDFLHYYRWMNSKHENLSPIHYKHKLNPSFEDWVEYRKKYKGDGKDTATVLWGGKWRTPTKEEFEELISKCKWEKIIIDNADEHALKVTGPNGNHIILRTTGYAGCREDDDRESAESIHSECRFWTSTEVDQSLVRTFNCAYHFVCSGYKNFCRLYTPIERVGFARMCNPDKWAANRKKDMEKRHALWLEEPIACLEVRPAIQANGYAIRPVMDKE